MEAVEEHGAEPHFHQPLDTYAGLERAAAITLLREFYSKENPNAPQPRKKEGRSFPPLVEG